MREKVNSNLKMLITLAIICFAFIMLSGKVFAAGIPPKVSLSCPNEAKEGETITISVAGNGGDWSLNLVINGESHPISRSGSGTENEAIYYSTSYTVTGPINVSLSGQIVGTDLSEIPVNESKTVNIVTPEPPPIQPENPDNPENPENPGENGNQTGEENQNPGGNNEPTTGGETGGNTQIPQPPVQEPEPENPKSGNNHLSSLNVDVGTLTPEFNRDRIEYTIKFPDNFDYKNLNTFKITAYVEDSNARVEGNRVVTVEEGDNTFEVKCIAEDGTPRIYKISVYKPIEIKQSDLRLKGIIINAIDDKGTFNELKLLEEFSPEKFEYKLNVEENITDLDIKTDIENKDIIIKIDGEKALKDGENIITITLISPNDENIKSIYTIKVNKEVAIDAVSNQIEENVIATNKSSNSNRKKYLLMIAIFVVILALAVIVLLVINHRNKYDNEFLKFNDKDDDEDDEVIIGKKDKTYLKDENLEKFTKRYEELEKQKEEQETEKQETEEIEQTILEEKIKEEKPEFKREVTIDSTQLGEIEKNKNINEENNTEINNILDELMEKKTKQDEIKTDNDNKNDDFSKDDFFNDINKKRGKHF